MTPLNRLVQSLSSPLKKSSSGSPSSTAGDARRRYEWRRRRQRQYSNPETVEKQSIDRRAHSYDQIRDSVINNDGLVKPYDPLYLRDLSSNAVIQAYIDTLAQDVATASWKLKPRDEDSNVSDKQLADWEREITDIHPELTFRDVREQTARILLQLGDATWVKHYYEGTDDLAEAVVVDSSTMFKKVDKYGIVDGYLQASRRNKQVTQQFDKDEVIWFSWAQRDDRHYGEGPVEKADGEIELLEELTEKERLDLVAGTQPGVMSPNYNDEFGGTVPDEDWDNFVEQMQLDEGERHRVGYSKIPVDFEPITPNYQELQVLERSKYWVTVVGSVFKVSPSYAGFDFENVNRATDESQQEAYAQKGFRVLLQQLEDAFNQGLIWSEFSDDVVFTFEREQTVDERENRASLIREQAEAGKQMASALEDSDATVSYRDGKLVVDDGEISPDDDAGGGDMGGLFQSVDGELGKSWTLDVEDGQEGFRNTETGEFRPLDNSDTDLTDGETEESSKENDDGRSLTKEQAETLDRFLLDAHRSQIQPETVDDIEKRAWSRDDAVPDYVQETVLEAIDRGAVFNRFEQISGTLKETLEDTLRDSLTQPQGWSLDSITDRLSDAFPGVDEDNLETVARTETTSVLNKAREQGYQDREDSDRFKFYWQGSVDSRTTQLCKDLMIATGVESGTPETDFSEVPGEPVDIDTLVRLEREASEYHFPDLTFRRHVPHINCRKTFVRDTQADVDIDVDVPDADDIELSKCTCGDAQGQTYDDVIKSVNSYVEGRSRRELEIEQACGESIIQVLRRAFDKSNGKVEPAKREINNRLETCPYYDHDSKGLLSKKTLYSYMDKYEKELDDLL